ncbi:MAG: hypothetical protein OHK93_007574 [Ramalina farinacea]|uniref:Uncharacterized protein n=1 Tax=Ramalina farinacea TaxID=258253 RepID=A0AA43QPZ8_9LECA|nr:hypothetical protein [Ramalina farinacea]
MNGDSYSSRGMAPTDALPRIRKHEDTHRTAGADPRYGSSRDHYMSVEATETEIIIEEVTGDGRDHPTEDDGSLK